MPNTGKVNTMQATNRIPNVLCGFLAVIVIASQMSAAAGIFAVQAGERQLFLDDVGITEMERVSRTMHRHDLRVMSGISSEYVSSLPGTG